MECLSGKCVTLPLPSQQDTHMLTQCIPKVEKRFWNFSENKAWMQTRTYTFISMYYTSLRVGKCSVRPQRSVNNKSLLFIISHRTLQQHGLSKKNAFLWEAWQDAKGSVMEKITSPESVTTYWGGKKKTVTHSKKAALKTGTVQLFGDINVWRQCAKKKKNQYNFLWHLHLPWPTCLQCYSNGNNDDKDWPMLL